MTEENKELLMKLLQQHKALGISDQIWSVKPSLAEKLVDIMEFVTDKDLITPEEIVSHFGFKPTTAKRYLRQLTEFGYLEAHGGNKNRTYSKNS